MHRLFPIYKSASLAVLVVLTLAFVPQQTAVAASRSHKHAVGHTARSPHAGGHSPAKSSAHANSHPVSSGRGRLKPSSRPNARNFKQVHGVGLPRNVRAVPAVMHIRRGALAAARRRAHADDATPRSLQRVRLAMPAPLFGSHESLVHQNEMAQADGLERILDDDDLADRINHGSLVPVPISASLRINTDLPENRRYCRPWTARFLSDLAQAHTKRFAATSLYVTSAVRTVEYQRRLRYTNGNAAAADGDIASPHLTGGTIDIAKQGLTSREIGWMRTFLTPLEQQGKIDVEEEFRQSCFHISVYKSYLSQNASPTNKPISPLASGSMLAARGR